MRYFCVTYDLRCEDGEYDYDYTSINKALLNLGGTKILKTVWILELEDKYTCRSLKIKLLKFFNIDKDGLYIAEINDNDYHNLDVNEQS